MGFAIVLHLSVDTSFFCNFYMKEEDGNQGERLSVLKRTDFSKRVMERIANFSVLGYDQETPSCSLW